ncbi:hypothetical protein KSD_41090 [Ktedonobacter sp. SOSP1-85]|nr:hypothetical protein KSD_41090 [Ktedonobacter sp. SOSP1-85]
MTALYDVALHHIGSQTVSAAPTCHEWHLDAVNRVPTEFMTPFGEARSNNLMKFLRNSINAGSVRS